MLTLALATLVTPEAVAPLPAARASQPTSARTQALLEQLRRLSPEARSRVVAQMESAVAHASPDSRPALEDLLRQIKAINETSASTAPDLQTSLDRFRKLKPDQRRKVLEAMELEAAKALPSARAGYAALLIQLRALVDKTPSTAPVKSSQNRIRSSLSDYRRLDTEGRAKVLAQLEADAAKADPNLRQTLDALIQRLKTIPPSSPGCER